MKAIKPLTAIFLALAVVSSSGQDNQGVDPNKFPVVFYIDSSGTNSGVCWMSLQSAGVSYYVRGGEFPPLYIVTSQAIYSWQISPFACESADSVYGRRWQAQEGLVFSRVHQKHAVKSSFPAEF